VPVPPAAVPPAVPVSPAAVPAPAAVRPAVPVPPAAVPAPAAVRPAVPVPPAAVPVALVGDPAHAPSLDDDPEPSAGNWELEDDDMAVAPAPASGRRDKREKRRRGMRSRRGVRQSDASVARPLLAAEEFEFSSDPDLPRGGPAPGAVIEVARAHSTVRRLGVMTIVLVLVAAGALGWYWKTHHALPFQTPVPPPNPARDLQMAMSTLVTPGDLSGWSTTAQSLDNPFAMGVSSSAQATAASAGASSPLAQCLGVSGSALSAATGAAGAAVPARTAAASSHLYADAAAGSLAGSVSEVMSSSSAAQADAKVFADASLFDLCYQPYVQAMLPYLSSVIGSSQKFDTATIDPLSVPAPGGRSVHAYGFQITLLGHSGNSGTTMVLDDVAVFGGRVQATLSMPSNVVFPVDTQAALVRAVEGRVTAVVGR